MSDMHFKKSGFTYSTCEPYKNLKKQEIHSVFIKMNWIKLVFNMLWLIEILKI